MFFFLSLSLARIDILLQPLTRTMFDTSLYYCWIDILLLFNYI